MQGFTGMRVANPRLTLPAGTVDLTGIEPATSAVQVRRSPKLSYRPRYLVVGRSGITAGDSASAIPHSREPLRFEPMHGFEPRTSLWKSEVLPLHHIGVSLYEVVQHV